MNGTFDSFQEFQEAIRKELEPRTMVQVLVLTIDNQRIACIGPVLHVPPLGLNVGDVQEIEFGEVIPAKLAAQLFNGEFTSGVKQ